MSSVAPSLPPELRGDGPAGRTCGEQVSAYPSTDPAASSCAPEGTGGSLPRKELADGMSERDPLSCFGWDSFHSELIFG